MIDQDWLNTIRGIGKDGNEILSLLGAGSEKVVFKARMPDGESFALATPRCTLAYHIKEISLFISEEPKYDLDVLNTKLLNLVGNDNIQRWSFWYDKAHAFFIKMISKHGVPGVVFTSSTPESVEYIPFFLHSPGIIERLGELVNWPDPDPSEPNTLLVHPNGWNHPFSDTVFSAREWAAEAKKAIENSGMYNKRLDPNSLYSNPLIIWGAAITSDFFTDEELPKAAQFVRENFGSLPERDDAEKIVGQFHALVSLLGQNFDDAPIERWIKFGELCGIPSTHKCRFNLPL